MRGQMGRAPYTGRMSRDDRLLRLSRDHHHALVLALRIQRELPAADEGAASALQADAVRFWTAGLQPHIEAENEALLSRIAAHGDAGLALAGRLQREHRELDEAMTTVRNGGAGAGGSNERRAALTRFGSILGAHIRWEERELFEWMQATLSTDDLREAGETFAMRLPAVPVACPTPQTL
jgi:hemerythrin-like domain-containing protein